MNHNASTVDCNISRFFIQTPTNENSASTRSLSTMMGVCRRLPGGVHASIIETGALCRAGPHGSTLQYRLATRAAGVARGKAAQAGLRQRWQLRPHKQRSSFGRWAPHFQLLPRQGPLYSLKCMVPEAAAHVLVSVGGWCGGGSGAPRRASTAASIAGM